MQPWLDLVFGEKKEAWMSWNKLWEVNRKSFYKSPQFITLEGAEIAESYVKMVKKIKKKLMNFWIRKETKPKKTPMWFLTFLHFDLSFCCNNNFHCYLRRERILKLVPRELHLQARKVVALLQLYCAAMLVLFHFAWCHCFNWKVTDFSAPFLFI